jgi:hypothetical protein
MQQQKKICTKTDFIDFIRTPSKVNFKFEDGSNGAHLTMVCGHHTPLSYVHHSTTIPYIPVTTSNFTHLTPGPRIITNPNGFLSHAMVKIGDRLGVYLFKRWVSPPTLTVAPRRRARNREA